MNDFIIAGLSGSLRVRSYNTSLLKKAGELMPDGMKMEILDYSDFPFYNQDIQDKGFPEPVLRLADKLRNSDALLIASPEYNFSVPGVLKNALDWISRIKGANNPVSKMPAGIIGISTGLMGTVRGQIHLRQILRAMDMNPMGMPEILIPRASEKFDGNNELTDQLTIEHIKKFHTEFNKHILRYKRK